jgi:hypothetical protein
MPILDQILGGGLAGVGDLVKKVVGTFKLDPTVQAQLNAAIEQNKFELAKLDADLEAKLADIQGQNIRADSQSGDKFTSRARPAFLWMMTISIFVSIVVFPIINIFMQGKPLVLDLPPAILELFGVGFLGYTGARSWEKLKGTDTK